MKITIKLFATLSKDRFDIETREISLGTTIKQIVDELGIPKEQAAIIFVNNRHATLDHTFTDGDTLAIFPPVGGG